MIIALLTGVAVMTATGQICIRAGASRIDTRHGLEPMVKSAIRPTIVAGLALALASPLLYFRALESTDLGFAHAVTATTHVLVLLGGRCILGERLDTRRSIGAALIIAGLLVWGIW